MAQSFPIKSGGPGGAIEGAPLVVLAIGGNSLTQAHQTGTIEEQYVNATRTCRAVVDLLEQGYMLVLTHGNGPQVGAALRRVELSRDHVYPLPLDICVADLQGGIGYMLQQILETELAKRGIKQPVATLVTQVMVDADDPSFQNPSKPVGPFLTEAIAKERMAQGFQLKEDAGRGWRRVVPSPAPQRIVELAAIRAMQGAGIMPIVLGGGGVPVTLQDGVLRGVEAVIDKDRATALLADRLDADLMLISTGVPQVSIGFGTENERPISRATASEMQRYLEDGEFAPGSMRPKVQAALNFVRGRRRAIITTPENLVAAVAGKAGTTVVAEGAI